MADEMFMYATTAGFMIGLGVLLFIVRGRRSKGVSYLNADWLL
jgi:presenilin-like A22 family membrane protease